MFSIQKVEEIINIHRTATPPDRSEVLTMNARILSGLYGHMIYNHLSEVSQEDVLCLDQGQEILQLLKA